MKEDMRVDRDGLGMYENVCLTNTLTHVIEVLWYGVNDGNE